MVTALSTSLCHVEGGAAYCQRADDCHRDPLPKIWLCGPQRLCYRADTSLTECVLL